MKVTYTADDGTEFDTADDCRAYEEISSVNYEKWRTLITSAEESSETYKLWIFLKKIKSAQVIFDEIEDFWTYRRHFVLLAKTLAEVDSRLRH